MADGFLGGLLGGEPSSAAVPATQDNPFGLSEADRLRIISSTLSQLGGTLLAAGQKQSPAQRAQYLAQLGNVGGNINSQMYQAAQGRLMAAQYNEKMQEMNEINAIRTQLKENPGELAKVMGIEESALTKLPATDIRAILRQKQITEATRLPEEREIKKIELEQKKSELERAKMAAAELQRQYGIGQPTAPTVGQPSVAAPVAGGMAPGAPAAGEAVAPTAAGAPAGTTPSGAYRLPLTVVTDLLAGGKKPTDILALQAQEALKQQTFIPVPTGDNEIRKKLGVSPTQPLKVKINSSGQVVDYELLGEDPNKPPVGFRVAGEGRLEPIPGGPGEQISAEVAARVGLAKAAAPGFADIRKALNEGYFDSAIGKLQVATGTGQGAALWRRMEAGREALIRGLTGAGMNLDEVGRSLQSYGLSSTDSSDTIRDKLNMLEWSLDNINYIVRLGRGENVKPTRPPPSYGEKTLEDLKMIGERTKKTGSAQPAASPAGGQPSEAPRVRRYNPETGMIE